MPDSMIERQDHPFDRGYWARRDGRPRPPVMRFARGVTQPVDPDEHRGWDTCDDELRIDHPGHHS